MSKENEAPDTLAPDEIAPHGWELHCKYREYGGVDEHSAPFLVSGGHIYVPVKLEPRTWEGTVAELRFNMPYSPLRDPWGWGRDTKIRVEEVLE